MNFIRAKEMKQLVECNQFLDDFGKLQEFFDDQGYLFFRNVLDASAVADARAQMKEVLLRHGLIKPDVDYFIST